MRSDEFESFDGDAGDVTCARCERLAVDDPDGALAIVTESAVEATDVVTSPFDPPSPADRGADPFEQLTAPVTDHRNGAVATARRLVFPVSFAALGGAAIFWMLRRRRR
ncbi:hypothetical protein BH20ACT4_BH20ACT4_01520 [soil metagenome]